MRSRSAWIGSMFQSKHWLVHLAVAAGYALAYSVVRIPSTSHWPFAFPLRVACLLLVPRCYWVAMLVGEFGVLVYFNAERLDDFGLAWVVLSSIPPLLLAMPVVAWFLRGRGLFPDSRFVNIRRLWSCMLASSLLWALATYVILTTVRLPSGAYAIPSGAIVTYFVNTYLVLLVFVPWVVMLRIRGRKNVWRLLPWREWLSISWARDAMMAVLVVVMLACIHHVFNAVNKFIMVTVLFLPAVWLTVKHGWRASVFGSTLALVAIASSWDWRLNNMDVLQMQWQAVFLITCLFMFGVRVSEQSQQHQQLTLTAQARQYVAKQALLRGESRLAQTSEALACVVGMLQMDYNHVLDHFVPPEHRDEQRKLAQQLQTQVMRLAESISPSAWRDRGIAAALNETVGGVLHEAGIAYECDASRRSLETLSQVLQAAIYRVSGEAMAVLSESYLCGHIDLTVRTLWRQRRRWVVLRIDSTEDEKHVARALQHAQERHRVGAKLGASMHSVDEVREFVRVFDGTLRMRRFSDGTRVSVLLQDGPRRMENRRTAPIRWLVK